MQTLSKFKHAIWAPILILTMASTAPAVELHVDPNGYEGQWIVSDVAGQDWRIGANCPGAGAGCLDLAAGDYVLTPGGLGAFRFSIAADGSVSVDDPETATGGNATLTFKTVTVTVDPNGSSTGWSIHRGDEWQDAGELRTLHFVPNVRYGFATGFASNHEFDVAPDGDVTPLDSRVAIGGSHSLTLEVLPVSVSAGAYPGQWLLGRGATRAAGSRTLNLGPAQSYSLQPAYPGDFTVNVDHDGNVTVPNGISAAGGYRTLTFHTQTVQVGANPAAGEWRISFVAEHQTGSQSVVLVPGAQYALHDYSSATERDFTLASPCALDPVDFSIDGYDYHLSCGLPDSDGDGVPNTTDNCPSAANADQLDRDNDGLGDPCDSDLDGDGHSNTLDNCPDLANPDQLNQDHDGMGDDCDDGDDGDDGDDDGDSVPDAVDNCPNVANTDQSDNDGDDAGDACDDDDDGDGVLDTIDNCPFTANAAQDDFDLDLAGDACDLDRDGDGVANDSDLCPFTPSGQPRDGDGCSGAQRIARLCVREDFVQHGKYVSCVAQRAQEAVELGLLTPPDKARFVREAAHDR